MRLAAGLVTLTLVGCGGGGRPRPPAATPAPAPRLATTTCGDWTEMSNATRRAFVVQLHLFYGAKVSAQYGSGNTIPDDEALVKLTQLCQRTHHDDVELYRIYGPLVAFTPPG